MDEEKNVTNEETTKAEVVTVEQPEPAADAQTALVTTDDAKNQNVMDVILKRMEGIEALLVEQRKHNTSIRRGNVVRNILLIVFVAVIAVSCFFLVTTIQGVAKDIPALIESLTAFSDIATKDLPGLIDSFKTLSDTATQDIHGVLSGISSIDFGGLNTAINGVADGISAIDFKGIADSVNSLKQAAQGLSGFMGMFGG